MAKYTHANAAIEAATTDGDSESCFPERSCRLFLSAGRRVSLIGKLFADEGHDAQVAMHRL